MPHNHDPFGQFTHRLNPGAPQPPHGQFDPVGASMLEDLSGLDSLVGEWSEVVRRVLMRSPEHWAAMALMILGLQSQVEQLSAKLDALTAADGEE